MLPLAACVTPEQTAQWKADRAAQLEKVAQAEPACAGKGFSEHSDAYVWCVNKQIRKDGIEIARLDNGALTLRDTQSGSFAYSETSMGSRTASGPVPLAVPVVAPMGR